MHKPIHLIAEQVELIHAGVLAKSGGLFGTRDTRILEKLESSPRQAVFGKELYPTLFHKAAVYAHTIIAEHPFLDGNKRTGMIAAFTFLDVNEYKSTATDNEVFEYAITIATEKIEIEAIAHWLKSHSRKVIKK